MSELKTFQVNTHIPYTVDVGYNLLSQSGSRLCTALGNPCKIVIVTDSAVAERYLNVVQTSLTAAGFTVFPYIYPAGKTPKNFDTLVDILEFMASKRMNRQDCVVTLGGGLPVDIGGFAASCYMRGIRYVTIPTTTLATLDAAFGGKTGIDLKAGKNMAGSVQQPAAVLCDIDVLSSLPAPVYNDGIAEAIKIGVLGDAEMFDRLTTGKVDTMEIISRSVAFKAGLISQDEFSHNVRRLLMFGHNFGHAIETCSHHAVTHGSGVAIGMAIVARAAEKLGWAKEPVSQRIEACNSAWNLPSYTDYSPEDINNATVSSMMRTGDHITLIVPETIGHCVFKSVHVDDLLDVLKAGM